MAKAKDKSNPNRPFEGVLRYLATDGRWIAGAPSRDITADEWEARGYSNRGNFTFEDLIRTGLYELDQSTDQGQEQKQGQGETGDTATNESSPEGETATDTDQGGAEKTEQGESQS